MKHKMQTGRNLLAVLLAVLLVALTASAAAYAVDVDYFVRFVNEYATKEIDKATDTTIYVGVENAQVLEEKSVPHGSSVSYEGVTPTRRKDKSYGEFNFVGWEIIAADGTRQAVDMPYAVTGDTTLYARFEGVEVTCEVDFRSDGVYIDEDGNPQPEIIYHQKLDSFGQPMVDDNGNPVMEAELNEAARQKFTVPYGGSVAEHKPAKDPTRKEQEHYKFVFDGWDYDYTHIYKNGSINAKFAIQGKTYTFEFYDYDNTLLGTREVVYGTACADAEGNSLVPPVKHRIFTDEQFNYYFNDEWNVQIDGLQKGEGEMVDMNAINFQTVQPDDNNVVKVYAQYWQQLKEYYFVVHVIDHDREPGVGVHVQVAGSENQLLTTFTDEALGQNGGVGVTDDEGKVYLSVPYQEHYTISAYDTYYNLAAQERLTLADIESQREIVLELGEPYALNNNQQYCNDVCHSFIGGLWITGLNLFYRLFKVKYVCCYDMYAAHGDKLVYASQSSGMTIDRS